MILGRKRCWYKQHIWLATWRRRPTQRPDLRCEKCGHKWVSESPLRRLHPCWGRDHPVQPRLSSQTNMHHVCLFHLNLFCFSLVSPSLSFLIFSLLQNMSPYHSPQSTEVFYPDHGEAENEPIEKVYVTTLVTPMGLASSFTLKELAANPTSSPTLSSGKIKLLSCVNR